MIQRSKLITALSAKADQFNNFDREFQDEAALYDGKLAEFNSCTYDEINSRLSHFDAPGALPADEYLNTKWMHVPFNNEWSNHELARNWAYKILLNNATFAADGSQIMPSQEFSIPVAGVQVAWFENPHTLAGNYFKDSIFEVLSPDDLLMGNSSERQISEQMVNLRRFQLEVKVLCDYMERYAQEHGITDRPPVVFLDSSIVISFAERWHEDQRKLFTEPIIKLLDTSAKTKIPVIGYVDTTYACDIAVMLKYFFNMKVRRSPVHDAYLFRNFNWGDRTIFFTCARAGLLDSFGVHARGVGFLYLKTNQNLPARLEMPVWIYEAGLLDYVIDIVRAEVIVGLGYPYPLATADAAAVITAPDREAFYRIFQQFINEQEIPIKISQKSVSKLRYR